MKSLYESILDNTRSGKNHIPLKFSKEYTFEEIDDAIEDYFDFYKRKNHYFNMKYSEVEDSADYNLTYILNNYAISNTKEKFQFVQDKEFYKKFQRCEEEMKKGGIWIFSPHVDYKFVWLVRYVKTDEYLIWDGYSNRLYNITALIKKYDLA